jgi:hypothetical protein
MARFLISDSGNDRIGQTKTYAAVLDNAAPVGSQTLVLSTTYSKARDPAAHQVKQTLHFKTAGDLAKFARFLLDQSQAVPRRPQASTPQEDDELNELLSPQTTIGDLIGDNLSSKDVTN